MALGNLLDYGIGDVFVKAGNQVTVVVGVDSATVDLFGGVGHGKGQAPLQQTAKQQIKVGAVGLDVVQQLVKHTLVVFPGRVVDVGHVGVIQFENAEANIQIISGQRILGLDFFSSAAYALFADFTNCITWLSL